MGCPCSLREGPAGTCAGIPAGSAGRESVPPVEIHTGSCTMGPGASQDWEGSSAGGVRAYAVGLG